MKILTKDEIAKLAFFGGGVGKDKNLVIKKFRELELGETLFFSTEEWVPKTGPSQLYRGAMKDDRRLSIRRLADKSGWIATRIK